MNKKAKSLIITVIITIIAICLTAAFVSRTMYCSECHTQIEGKAYLVEESYGDHEREYVCEKCLRTISFWYDDDDYTVIKTVNLHAGKTVLIILEILIGGGVSILLILGKDHPVVKKLNGTLTNAKSSLSDNSGSAGEKYDVKLTSEPKAAPPVLSNVSPSVIIEHSVPDIITPDNTSAVPAPSSGLKSTMRKAETTPIDKAPEPSTPKSDTTHKYFTVKKDI